jgi:hypothetical protein
MNRHAVLAAAGAAALALVLGTGCSGGVRDANAPTCSTSQGDVLLLVAQSVPTADRIPCITGYPAGWKLGSVDVRNGRASFSLNAADGSHGVKVVLAKDCPVADATEFPTDEPGTTRYDRLPAVDGARMVRTYTFGGGCAMYEFRLPRRAAAMVDEASLALSFLTRAEVDARYAAGAR